MAKPRRKFVTKSNKQSNYE